MRPRGAGSAFNSSGTSRLDSTCWISWKRISCTPTSAAMIMMMIRKTLKRLRNESINSTPLDAPGSRLPLGRIDVFDRRRIVLGQMRHRDKQQVAGRGKAQRFSTLLQLCAGGHDADLRR